MCTAFLCMCSPCIFFLSLFIYGCSLDPLTHPSIHHFSYCFVSYYSCYQMLSLSHCLYLWRYLSVCMCGFAFLCLALSLSCVYVCVCAHIHLYMHMVCVQVHVQVWSDVCVSWSASYVLGQVSHWNWSSLSYKAWSCSRPVSLSPVMGLQALINVDFV